MNVNLLGPGLGERPDWDIILTCEYQHPSSQVPVYPSFFIHQRFLWAELKKSNTVSILNVKIKLVIS